MQGSICQLLACLLAAAICVCSVNAHPAADQGSRLQRIVRQAALKLRPPKTRADIVALRLKKQFQMMGGGPGGGGDGGEGGDGGADAPTDGTDADGPTADSPTTTTATSPEALSPISSGPEAASTGSPTEAADDAEVSIADGQTESDLCVATFTSDGYCFDDGSSNYVDFSDMVYDSTTGMFSGTMITNQCNAKSNTAFDASALCVSVEFPDPLYVDTPSATPGLGVLGYSFFGENINGPLEGGFQEGQVCTDGSCESGGDLATCVQELFASCSEFEDDVLTEDLSIDLVNECGGHANVLHYHENMICHYDFTNEDEHSAAIGVMNDGRLLYGFWEGAGAETPELDACNGHFGTVPANDTLGVESNCVYHYHMTEGLPFTIGCYGPVESVAECKDLFLVDADAVASAAPSDGMTVDEDTVGCLDGFTDLYLADYYGGEAELTPVDIWCTCYTQSANTPNSCEDADGPAAIADGPDSVEDDIEEDTSAAPLSTPLATSTFIAVLIVACARLVNGFLP